MAVEYFTFYRIVSEQFYGGQLMNNTFHVATHSPLLLAEQTGLLFYADVIVPMMKLQVNAVTHSRLIVTRLHPADSEMAVIDLGGVHPQTDVDSLPSICAWKWTSRNLATLRYYIGGFYLGGLQRAMFTNQGVLTNEGSAFANTVRNEIMGHVGVGGGAIITAGVFSRRFRQQFPNAPFEQAFVGWSKLTYNLTWTSQRKRTPGVGM